MRAESSIANAHHLIPVGPSPAVFGASETILRFHLVAQAAGTTFRSITVPWAPGMLGPGSRWSQLGPFPTDAVKRSITTNARAQAGQAQ